jgi:hypothetical protein
MKARNDAGSCRPPRSSIAAKRSTALPRVAAGLTEHHAERVLSIRCGGSGPAASPYPVTSEHRSLGRGGVPSLTLPAPAAHHRDQRGVGGRSRVPRDGILSCSSPSMPSRHAFAVGMRRVRGARKPLCCLLALQGEILDGLTTKLGELNSAVATAGGNRAVSPRRYSPGYNPLKAETRVRIPLMG